MALLLIRHGQLLTMVAVREVTRRRVVHPQTTTTGATIAITPTHGQIIGAPIIMTMATARADVQMGIQRRQRLPTTAATAQVMIITLVPGRITRAATQPQATGTATAAVVVAISNHSLAISSHRTRAKAEAAISNHSLAINSLATAHQAGATAHQVLVVAEEEFPPVVAAAPAVVAVDVVRDRTKVL